MIENDKWNRFIFSKSMCPTVLFRQWKKHNWSTQQNGAERKETSLLQKNKKERKAKKKKRRYMKSSCRWTTIHFHFEVLRTVVKCDCIWQLPSLPVYHDGYTLPPWWCCSTCTLLCTHTQVHGYRDAQKWVYQTWTWHRQKLHIRLNVRLTHTYRDKVIWDSFSDWDRKSVV